MNVFDFPIVKTTNLCSSESRDDVSDFCFSFIAETTKRHIMTSLTRLHFEQYFFLHHILVFFLIMSRQYMQKYITAVGSKLLRHQK